MTAPTGTVPHTTGLVLHWAVRYDLLVWLLTHGRDRAFREKLATLVALKSGESVLDIGCGTGSLAIVAKRHVGATGRVVGVDASPQMITRATSKAGRAGTEVTFETAAAEALPFPDAQFDAVLSTLMLHHLPRPVRQRCAREIRRTLKPEAVCSLSISLAHRTGGAFSRTFIDTVTSIHARSCRCSNKPASGTLTAGLLVSAVFSTCWPSLT